MTRRTMPLTISALTLMLCAFPAFAQRGAGVGVSTHTHTSGTATKGPHAADAPKADFTTKIEANPKLSAKLQAMLPSGESLSQAAAGFKNEGQFIAALHVSHNLNIPFDQLKAKLTGSNSISLGAAIK